MVRIVDDSDHFEAPIDKIWKLIEAHQTEMTTIHPGAKNPKMEGGGDNWGVVSWDSDQGHMKLKVTAFPPIAQVLEIMDGPLTGTKFVNYYTPKGSRTGVTVVGDFHSKVIPEHQLEGAAREFLKQGFEEDSAYLRKMK
jgi:hypothetical protein